MSVILMKQTAIGKRAYAISREEAEAMVNDGKAVQDKVHLGIYEEITGEERDQGYLTRNMIPLPLKKRQQRKARGEGESE